MQEQFINSDFSNVSEFIDSLFVPDNRTMKPIQEAISKGKLTAAFSSEVEKILPVWLAIWQKAQGDPYSDKEYAYSKLEDQQIFTFLSDYIKQNNLFLYVPQLILVSGSSVMPPVYQLSGYKSLALFQHNKWNYESVLELLNMFLFGAHFVVIHHREDLPPNVHVTNFYDAFCTGILASGKRRNLPGHSHYTSIINPCGYFFPSVDSNSTPQNPVPFSLAWLIGLTSSNIICKSSSANTFFQLEGWQAPFARHNADYETHKKTLWNISTYGACAYSEKRGTALFLAPSVWDAKPNSKTFMPPYVGAKQLQSWLNTEVITLP